MNRVRVYRERPTALAMVVALCVTMLVVYVLTLNLGGPDVVESMAPAPRVTREIEFGAREGWCVAMAACESREQARVQASGWVNRGAAGCVAQLDGAWRVLGAVYDSEREAGRVAKRLRDDEDIPAETLALRTEAVKLRITAPERQIDAIAAADALLRRQEAQLGQVALQLDRSEIRPEAVRTLCALAASEAGEASAVLSAIPGAAENGLCAALIGALDALRDMQKTLSESPESAAALSGMLRCAQIETILRQKELIEELGIRH